MNKQQGFAPILIFIFGILIFVGIGAFLYFSRYPKDAKNTKETNSLCNPLQKGIDQNDSHIFLDNVSKKGYEAIVRKKVTNQNINFDIITNMLPEPEAPYKVWIVDTDNNGKACNKKYLGNLAKDAAGNYWTITFSSQQYTDDAQNIIVTNKGGDLDEMLVSQQVVFKGSFAGVKKEAENGEKPVFAKILVGLEKIQLVSYSMGGSSPGYKLMNKDILIKDFGLRYFEGQISHDHNLVALVNNREIVIYDYQGNLIEKKEFKDIARGVSKPSWSIDDRYMALTFLTEPDPLSKNNYLIWRWDNQEKVGEGSGSFGIEECYAGCYPSPLLFSPINYQYLWMSTMGETVYLEVNTRDNPKTQYSSGCPWDCGAIRYKLPLDKLEARNVKYKWSDDGQAVLYKLTKDTEYTKILLSEFKY